MKVVAKTDEGYLVSITYAEAGILKTGETYSSVLSLKTGEEINFARKFDRVMRIFAFATGDNYDSVRYRLKRLLEDFEPIEDGVNHIKNLKNE